MATRRMDRVNVLLRHGISEVLSRELNDPRLSSVISVVRVDCAPDLHNARVFVSVLGDANRKKDAMRALQSASGFIHRTLRKGVSIKTVPFLEFRLDESIEQGAELLEFMKQTSALDSQNERIIE
jgi:ribosome-binding factor A